MGVKTPSEPANSPFHGEFVATIWRICERIGQRATPGVLAFATQAAAAQERPVDLDENPRQRSV